MHRNIFLNVILRYSVTKLMKYFDKKKPHENIISCLNFGLKNKMSFFYTNDI